MSPRRAAQAVLENDTSSSDGRPSGKDDRAEKAAGGKHRCSVKGGDAGLRNSMPANIPSLTNLEPRFPRVATNLPTRDNSIKGVNELGKRATASTKAG